MTHDSPEQERRDRICRLGEEAFERLQRKDQEDWNSYMTMGEAFQCGREEAFTRSGTNNINDPRYKRAFAEWLARYPKLGSFDRSDRAKLFVVMEHRGEIESWRSTLTWTQRSKMNHPTHVLNKWKKQTQVPTTDARPQRETELIRLRREKTEWEREKAHLEERLAAVDAGSLFDLRRDSAEDIAQIIVGQLTVYKAKAIMAAVKNLLRQPTPAG